MTVRKGGKIIAGNSKAVGSSWEVGDVGISAFGIDEALNKRRYLNGQVISQAQFVEFTAMLKSRVSVYPNLATSEVNWQATVTNSDLGQCGQFVIDDVAGTIRLPKVVNINGLQDLTGLGTIKAESLPNIKGRIGRTEENLTYGAFYATYENNYGQMTSGVNRYIVDFDASRSSSTYQDDAPVQQEAVQYPYFIQVAEGVETSIDVSEQIKLNLPFSLLDYKYSEYELDNASWLLSNGQWNSGAVYQSVYDLLLQIYNGTVTKAGVSVKLSTEAYADTDFVLNTGDTTFRLPLKVALASGKAIAGNGKALGLTDGTSNGGLITASGSVLRANTGLYDVDVGTSYSTGSDIGSNKAAGVVTDPDKSGIETSTNGLYLYFYVGETVQDANIIAAASVLTDVADLKNASNFSSLGKETIVSWVMPSSTATSLTVGASNSEYTAPANGWFYVLQVNNSNGYLNLYNKTKAVGTMLYTISGVAVKGYIPVKKGDTAVYVYAGRDASSTINEFYFIYAEGEE